MRVNLPGHSPPYTTYDPTGVRSGLKSMHCWAEKAWKWGYNIGLLLPYGEIDEKTSVWIPPATVGRKLTNVYDMLYYPPGTPDAVIQSVLPSEYGRAHWSHDWITYAGGVYKWWNSADSSTWDCLIEPRARIVNNELGGINPAYMRIYFKVKKWTSNLGVQLIRFYGTDYIAMLTFSPSEITVYIPNVVERFVSIPAIKLNAWYYLEAGFTKSSSGGIQVWLGEDGQTPQLVANVMGLNTSGLQTPSSFQTGLVDIFDYGRDASPPDDYQALDMYFDDWAIGDSYIGPVQVTKVPTNIFSTPLGQNFGLEKVS